MGLRARFKLPGGQTNPSHSALEKRPASRIARQLALAHHIERLVESGELESYAEAARELGITRARMAQAQSLLNLSAKIQDWILAGELVKSERALRGVLREPNWEIQVALSS